MRKPAAVLAPFVLAAACLPCAAQQALKPGLWEINNKMQGNPEVDAAMARLQQQMAAMSPEQRKQVEAAMAQRGMRMQPASGGMTIQMCMTPEMSRRNDMPMREGCTATKQERSGNTLKVAFSCANPPSSGEGEFTMNGDQAYSSHMVVKTVMQGRETTTEMNATGKWLGADCGSVKPPQLAK